MTFERPGTPFPFSETLGGALGIEILEGSPDRMVARMPLDARTRQPYGVMHGGAVAALAETVASVGTYLGIDYPRELAFGQDFHYTLLRTVREGSVTATATPIHRGRSSWVWNVDVHDDQGRLTAVCRCSIAVRPNREAQATPQA